MDYANLGNTGLQISRAADLSALPLDIFRDVDASRDEGADIPGPDAVCGIEMPIMSGAARRPLDDTKSRIRVATA